MTTVAALCAGYGGLELGLTHAGIDHTLAWYAEIDPHASTVMAHHHPAAPNLGDLRDITNPPPVDIVTAGFPCQPVSTAGARLGIDDGRWLIRDVVTVWQSSGARWLILENVWGLLTANDGRAFGEVLDALATVGATARWACVRASDIGAPHRRTRWFCVAHADGQGREGEGHPQPPGRHGPRVSGNAPTDPGSGQERFQPVPVTRCGGPLEPGLHRQAPADPDGGGCQGEWLGRLRQDSDPLPGPDPDGRLGQRFGAYAPAIARWEHALRRPAPDPTVNSRLNPAFVEWMMGLPAGWVTGCGLSRNNALRVLGNGVVPQQAAHALTQLEAAA